MESAVLRLTSLQYLYVPTQTVPILLTEDGSDLGGGSEVCLPGWAYAAQLPQPESYFSFTTLACVEGGEREIFFLHTALFSFFHL